MCVSFECGRQEYVMEIHDWAVFFELRRDGDAMSRYQAFPPLVASACSFSVRRLLCTACRSVSRDRRLGSDAVLSACT